MKLDVYTKFVEVTEKLGSFSNPDLIFQTFVEDKLNNLKYSKFLQSQKDKLSREFYIRLKSPKNKNSSERGLKICLFNDNIFKEKYVAPGTTIFKFDPMLKVIGFSNQNCCECGKYLVESDEKESQSLKNSNENEIIQKMESMKIEDVIQCNICNLRVFCSKSCNTKAKFDWHNLECDFINFLKTELVFVNQLNPKNDDESNKWETMEIQQELQFERVILLVVTTFRLLICLSKEDEEIAKVISSMSDHFNLYKDFIENGIAQTPEHEILFNEVTNTFQPLIKNYFSMKRNEILKSKPTNHELDSINENGIFRALFIILVNVSSFMDYFNENLGLMFDPTFSAINHSCDPNCTLIWKDQGTVLIKTIKELKASNELTLNYIPIYMPKEMRRKQLKNSFFFDCECYKCVVLDKEFDSMLPINCYYCGKNNKGFHLENFKISTSPPKMERDLICCNCENLIEVDKLFEKYLAIFNFFKELNKDIGKIEDLCNWKIDSLNKQIFTDNEFNKSLALFKECFAIVPLISWPMTMLSNLVKNGFQQREPLTLNVLRLTYLSNFFIENLLEKNEVFNTSFGASLYDLAVFSADYLFDQYLRFRESIETDIISIVGWGAFSLCILAFKQLEIRFLDESNVTTASPLERAQEDMIQLSREIQSLLEHYYKNTDPDGCKNFSQHKFETSIYEFERYLQCGGGTQLQQMLLQLQEDDYTVFNVQKRDDVKAEVVTEVVAEEVAASASSRFVAVPDWVSHL